MLSIVFLNQIKWNKLQKVTSNLHIRNKMLSVNRSSCQNYLGSRSGWDAVPQTLGSKTVLSLSFQKRIIWPDQPGEKYIYIFFSVVYSQIFKLQKTNISLSNIKSTHLKVFFSCYMLPFRSSFGTPKTDSKFWAFISISKKKKNNKTNSWISYYSWQSLEKSPNEFDHFWSHQNQCKLNNLI